MTKIQGWFVLAAICLIAMSVSDTSGTSIMGALLYTVAWAGIGWEGLEIWDRHKARQRV